MIPAGLTQVSGGNLVLRVCAAAETVKAGQHFTALYCCAHFATSMMFAAFRRVRLFDIIHLSSDLFIARLVLLAIFLVIFLLPPTTEAGDAVGGVVKNGRWDAMINISPVESSPICSHVASMKYLPRSPNWAAPTYQSDTPLARPLGVVQ